MTHPIVHLEIEEPEGRRQAVLEGPGPWWLGREETCAVPLPSANISRRHVRLEWSRDGLLVTDASSNGTIVDEFLLQRGARLLTGSGSLLRLGPFQVRVRIDQRKESQGKPLRPAATPERDALPPALGVEARRNIHRQLLENLDLPKLERTALDPASMRPEVVAALRRIVARLHHISAAEQERLVRELSDEALGLGPLEQLLADPNINEIMVVDPHTIFVERRGKIELTGLRFTDDDSVRAVIERVVTPLGRRIDESTPLVDARLKDGSRVNAIIPPLALKGPCITIRKFAKEPLRMQDLVRFDSVTSEMARFLERSVRAKKNIVISGGTGSGKTTLLNVLSAAIPSHERVVTVEDAAELQLAQPHVVSLEARPPNLEGKGEYTIRDLVKNALRMRPDRIVVGECRGPEAIDMLQAMNTGHEGSLTTTHANSPGEAVARIETLCLMAGLDLPIRAIRQQIVSSIHLIVQQNRASDGSRRVTNISEVVGVSDDGDVELREIYVFRCTRVGEGGKLEGEFLASGYLPSFLDQFVTQGLAEGGAFP